MRLEFLTIAGEDVPFIILNCDLCNGEIALRECDVKITKEFECCTCRYRRFLNYREVVTISDRFACTLLQSLVQKLQRNAVSSPIGQ